MKTLKDVKGEVDIKNVCFHYDESKKLIEDFNLHVKPGMRIAIVGPTGCGKSTFINSYARKACTKVGNKPGVTKGKQWIRLGKDIELLDTPGILWPKFDDKEVGLRLAFIGSINDEILSITDLAYELIKFLQLNYCQSLVDRYNINEDADSVHILEQIAEKRACIKKGGELDIDKAAAQLLDDFRAGKLGRISLERPAVVKDK